MWVLSVQTTRLDASMCSKGNQMIIFQNKKHTNPCNPASTFSTTSPNPPARTHTHTHTHTHTNKHEQGKEAVAMSLIRKGLILKVGFRALFLFCLSSPGPRNVNMTPDIHLRIPPLVLSSICYQLNSGRWL